MYIFDKRVDNIILDLKKRSFQLQQDLRDGEGEAWDPSYPDMSIDLFFFPQVVRAALVE